MILGLIQTKSVEPYEVGTYLSRNPIGKFHILTPANWNLSVAIIVRELFELLITKFPSHVPRIFVCELKTNIRQFSNLERGMALNKFGNR